MIDAKRLLDQFLGGNQWNSGRRPGAPLGGFGGGLGDMVGKAQDYARQNPALAGALGGGLASLLLGSKGGRKLAKNVLSYGGIAAIGGLAYKAYRDYQAGQAGHSQTPQYQTRGSVPAAGDVAVLPPPADSPFAIANAPQGADVFALELVSAMIAAAKADGHIDDQERSRIFGRLSEGGLDAEEQAFLERELKAPLDIERIVRAAKNKEEAVELYAASFLAINPDHPAERGYLAMLAARLGLEPELVKSIEQTVASAATS